MRLEHAQILRNPLAVVLLHQDHKTFREVHVENILVFWISGLQAAIRSCEIAQVPDGVDSRWPNDSRNLR